MKKRLCFALSLVLFIVFAVACKNTADPVSTEKMKVNLYFPNGNGEINTEQRDISYTNQEDLVNKTIQELLKGPSNPSNRRIIPKDTTLLDAAYENDVLVVNFSKQYNDMTSVNELLARYTIVNTLCGLPDTSLVRIQVEGKDILSPDQTPVGPLRKEDVILSSTTPLKKYTNLKLYFAEAQAQYLVPEERDVVANESEALEKTVLTELMNGPKDTQTHFPTIPAEAKLLSVEVKDGVCFVNFSKEFITKHSGGSTGEAMTIYSVVNSLTELPNIEKVQFLIDGQKVDTFINLIFNEPFSRDESLIQE